MNLSDKIVTGLVGIALLAGLETGILLKVREYKTKSVEYSKIIVDEDNKALDLYVKYAKEYELGNYKKAEALWREIDASSVYKLGCMKLSNEYAEKADYLKQFSITEKAKVFF